MNAEKRCGIVLRCPQSSGWLCSAEISHALVNVAVAWATVMQQEHTPATAFSILVSVVNGGRLRSAYGQLYNCGQLAWTIDHNRNICRHAGLLLCV